MDSDGHTTGIRFSQVTGLMADDISTAKRIVGFHEYTKSLGHLDAFLATATPTQIAAANEIVKRRDEFSVYVNLSRLNRQKSTDLAEKPTSEDDHFQRRGLAWLTAIARVEVQAVLAAFTARKEPFLVFPPLEFDADEYDEVLLDGMRTHFWAFQNDPIWPIELATKTPSSRTLAYLRRLAMLNAFVRTAANRWEAKFDVGQAAEITSWQRQIRQSGQLLKSKVQTAIAMSQRKNAVASRKFQMLLGQCKGTCSRLQ